MSGDRLMVSRVAWEALRAAIDAQPDQPTTGAALFVTGGPMADVELETNYDWALYNAAHRLRRFTEV